MSEKTLREQDRFYQTDDMSQEKQIETFVTILLSSLINSGSSLCKLLINRTSKMSSSRMFYLLFAVIIYRYCCLIKIFHSNLGKNFWKFNCSLIQDELYVLKMKKHIENIISSFDSLVNH